MVNCKDLFTYQWVILYQLSFFFPRANHRLFPRFIHKASYLVLQNILACALVYVDESRSSFSCYMVGNYLLTIFTSASYHHAILIRSKSKRVTIAQKVIYLALLIMFTCFMNIFLWMWRSKILTSLFTPFKKYIFLILLPNTQTTLLS